MRDRSYGEWSCHSRECETSATASIGDSRRRDFGVVRYENSEDQVMSRLRSALLVWLLVIACQAVAVTRIPIGLKVGSYFPTCGETRGLFGDIWPIVSISPMRIGKPERWSLAADITVYDQRWHDNRALLIPITIGVAREFGISENTKPYVALRVGPSYASVDAKPNAYGSGWGWNANAAVGVTFSERFYFEVRYDWFDEMEGLDFSGLQLLAGFRLFELKL